MAEIPTDPVEVLRTKIRLAHLAGAEEGGVYLWMDQAKGLLGTLEAAEAERDQLREALKKANQLLRSAIQVSNREMVHSNTTNWGAFVSRLEEALNSQLLICAALAHKGSVVQNEGNES